MINTSFSWDDVPDVIASDCANAFAPAPLSDHELRLEGIHPTRIADRIARGHGHIPICNDCKMEWNSDGTLLRCPVCHLDGT